MLGEGIYSLAAASRYLGVSASTLRSWFLPRPDRRGRGPIFHSDFRGPDVAISFLNLIESHVARFFREQGVSPVTVRKAHQRLAVDLSTKHPFAHADLRTDGRAIIRRTAAELGHTELVDVVGRQHFFTILDDSLARVEYSGGKAVRWLLASGVTIDPQIALGKPVVSDTAIATYVVANAFAANDRDADLVGDLFGIDAARVRDAVAFEAMSRRAA